MGHILDLGVEMLGSPLLSPQITANMQKAWIRTRLRVTLSHPDPSCLTLLATFSQTSSDMNIEADEKLNRLQFK